MTKPLDIARTFAVLAPDLGVRPVEVTPSLYADLDRDFGGFGGHTLVSCHDFTRSWSSWERHPAGDEIVMLLEGGARLRLDADGGEQVLLLEAPGSYVIVPRGVWHTADIDRPARLLFLTPGEGTENRARV